MNTDLTFITNEENQSLKERFEVLIKDISFFDCLTSLMRRNCANTERFNF